MVDTTDRVQILAEADRLVQWVIDLWGQRMRRAAAESILNKYRMYSMVEIENALRQDYQHDPDAKRPLWERIGGRLRAAHRMTYSDKIDNESKPYRDWVARWPQTYAKELIAVSERDPEKILPADWRAWTEVANDHLSRYKRDYGFRTEWPMKDREGNICEFVIWHAGEKITQEQLKERWTEALMTCHQRVRNLRTFGIDTERAKEQALRRLVTDGQKIGLSLEGNIAQEEIPF